MPKSFEIGELLAIFRAGLIALIPMAERARIAWRGPDVYDDWEAIEQTLFASTIGSVVKNALPAPPFPLAIYSIVSRSYSDRSFLTEQASRLRGDFLMLLELTTASEPFDTINFLRLNLDLGSTDEIVKIPLSQAVLELAARTSTSITYRTTIEYDD